jgi:hypothetical protein
MEPFWVLMLAWACVGLLLVIVFAIVRDELDKH